MSVTVSIGVAYLDTQQTAGQLVHAADLDLQAGRRHRRTSGKVVR